MIKTFEQYDHSRSQKLDEMIDKITKVYDEGGLMNVRILRGLMDIAQTSTYLNFSIFGDHYAFKQGAYGDMDIFGRITNDSTGRFTYDADLDEEEFNNVYDSIMIALNFAKINVQFLKDHNKESGEIFDSLDTFFYNWDNHKPETFYKEYIKFYKDQPFYISIIDWTEDKMKGFTTEEKNLVKSLNSVKKFNLFESSNNAHEDFYEYVMNLKSEYAHDSIINILKGQLIIEYITNKQDILVELSIIGDGYCITKNLDVCGYYGNPVEPRMSIEDSEIENIKSIINIMLDFIDLDVDIGDPNINHLYGYLYQNVAHYAHDFYSKFYKDFNHDYNMLKFVKWNEEKMKGFSEKDKTYLRSLIAGNKFKIFGD